MTSKVHYRPIEAAIRWSLQRHEHQILRLGSRAGMIHDTGYLLQLSYSPNTWINIVSRLENEERDNAPHELQGEELGRFWSLPAPVVAATKAHHEPDSCADAQARWLSGLIGLSEALLRRTSSPTKIAADRWSAEALRGEQDIARESLPALHSDSARAIPRCS
jgi:HD-like signal output (HDOD) protein